MVIDPTQKPRGSYQKDQLQEEDIQLVLIQESEFPRFSGGKYGQHSTANNT